MNEKEKVEVGMIELSQPLQCLLCPQRKKIALMFKILLAASTAIIVGLLLFLPRSSPGQRQPVVPNSQLLNAAQISVSSGESGDKNDLEAGNSKIDQQLEQQIRLKAEQEYQDLQAQLSSMLDSEPVRLSEAQKLLQARRRRVLLEKTLLLGKASFGKLPQAPENKLRLQLLDKELKLISQQLDLLARAASKE